jgi:2,3-bisphosphoglycerate-independent phosphoglycerate mutase
VNKKRVSEGKLKANIILSRDAGDELPKFYNLCERYKVRFACLADMPVERGISRLVGMHLVEIPPPSGNIMADSKLRADNLLNLLPTFDCFYIHLKGPDEAGHDGEFERKTQIIKEIDNHFFGKIVKEIDLEKTVLCVTADHSTPCRLKSHSDDPVPLLIAGGKIKPDGIKKFSEKESAKGSLGTLKSGTELMPILMHLIRQS